MENETRINNLTTNNQLFAFYKTLPQTPQCLRIAVEDANNSVQRADVALPTLYIRMQF